MSVSKVLRCLGAAASVAVSVLLLTASGAFAASSVYICVGEEAGSPVRSGGATGSCKTKETSVALPSEKAHQETLLSILPHMKYEASGVAGKPTIQVSGVNVQVVNGEGKTATVNGEGNLVIGYDELESGPTGPPVQTGSHDLILGERQTFTSYGGLDAGWENKITAPWTSVSGGAGSRATSEFAAISGGDANRASGIASSVSGGDGNKATGWWGSINGGNDNVAGEGEAPPNPYNTPGAWVGGGHTTPRVGFSPQSAAGASTRPAENIRRSVAASKPKFPLAPNGLR